MHAFQALVWAVAVLTLARFRTRNAPRRFLGVCVLGQAFALLGMHANVSECIAVGHVVFTSALWLGALGVDGVRGVELALVGALAAFTLVTRHRFGYCLFAKVRGSTATNDVRYDVLYVVPLVLALARLCECVA